LKLVCFILPSSLSSVVPACSPLTDGVVGANENFGGVAKLIEDAKLVDDFSVFVGLPKEGELNVD
jgi:hypothetical protein